MARSCLGAMLALLAAALPAQQGWPESRLFGRVVDALHEGVPMANVWVTDASGKVVARTVADGSGLYQLRGLPFGELVVHVEADGKVRHSSKLRSHGHRRQATLRLDGARALTGAVSWPDGSPVAGADVLVRESGLQTGRNAWSVETTTDADGKWRVAAAPLHQIHLTVFQPGFAPALRAIGRDEGPHVALLLGRNKSREHVVEVGGVPDGAAAQVYYQQPSSAYGRLAPVLPRRARVARVGVDGVARLWSMPSRQELRVRCEGMSSMPVAIRLPPGADKPLRFELERAPDKLVTSRTVMHGKVVDELGRPLAGVPVVSRFEGQRSAPVASGDDGSFRIEVPIYAGVLVEIGVLSEERYLGVPKAQLGGDGICWLTVAADPDKPLRIDAGKAGAVRGTLRTPGGGYLSAAHITLTRAKPVPGAVVTASDAGGRIDLRGLPQGSYRLRATGSDGRVAETTVVVVPGQTVEPGPLEFELGASLSGVVRDDNGKPVPLAELVVMPTREGRRRGPRRGRGTSARADENGRYHVPFVPEGSYVVVAGSVRRAVALRNGEAVEVVDGKPVTFDVRAPR